MAATEALVTWGGGLAERRWSDETDGDESMEMMRARLQAMTWASQAKDAALEDLHRRLQVALQEAEQGRAREAALKRRAETAEQAEEALASQMGELEAEAFARITESSKLLAAYQWAAGASERLGTCHVEPSTPSQLQSRLQAALEEAAAGAQHCKELEEAVEQGRAREIALERRAETAEAAEEALASEMAELEAEAFTRIKESNELSASLKGEAVTGESLEQRTGIRHVETERSVNSHLAELKRRLGEAESALEAVHTELRQSEEKNRWLELALAQQQGGGEKLHQQQVTLKRKQGAGEAAGCDTLLSLSLQDLAGLVKLKLWNPSALTLTRPS